MAENSKMTYFEASAFSGEGVSEFFEGTAHKLIENQIKKEQERKAQEEEN
jgi:hypothetical protein